MYFFYPLIELCSMCSMKCLHHSNDSPSSRHLRILKRVSSFIILKSVCIPHVIPRISLSSSKKIAVGVKWVLVQGYHQASSNKHHQTFMEVTSWRNPEAQPILFGHNRALIKRTTRKLDSPQSGVVHPVSDWDSMILAYETHVDECATIESFVWYCNLLELNTRIHVL